MQGKQPIHPHRGYDAQITGDRVPVRKSFSPNFTGTGLRVDLAGCGLPDGEMYHPVTEYGSDLDGRVSR